MAGAILLTRVLPAASLACNLSFWLCLLAFLRGRGHLTELPAFLPFAPAFYATFLFHRDVVEIWDYILGSDTARYLTEAAAFTATPRHIGYTVLIFPFSPLNAAGSLLTGFPKVGREYLYLESAAVGVLSLALFRRLLRRVGVPPRTSLWISYAFGCSFAIWTFSSVVETFIISVLLLFVLLLELVGFGTEAPATVTTALLVVLALAVSLENLYFIPVFGAALLFRFRNAWDWRSITTRFAWFLLVTAISYAALLKLAEWRFGPDFYANPWEDRNFREPAHNLLEHLHHFSFSTTDFARASSPSGLAGVAGRVFVMSIKAQPGAPPRTLA